MSPFRSKPIKNSCEFHQKKGPDRDSENAPVRAGFNFRISSCFFYHLVNPYLHDLFASVQGVAFFPILLQHTQDLGFTQAIIENEYLSILVNPSTEVGFKPAPSEKRCDNVEIYCLENLKCSRQILKFPIPNPHFP